MHLNVAAWLVLLCVQAAAQSCKPLLRLVQVLSELLMLVCLCGLSQADRSGGCGTEVKALNRWHKACIS